MRGAIVAVTVLAFALAACPADEPAEEDVADISLHLQFASYIGGAAPQMETMEWWADELQARSEADISVEFFYAQGLLNAEDILPGVGEGRADAGYTAVSYHPGDLPLTTVVEIPFITDNAAAQALALQELYETHDEFRAEWDARDVRVLFFPALSGNILGSTTPVESLDDIEGLSVRGLGLVNQALEAVGADPVAIPAPEIYESLQRDVIDAYSGFAFEVVTALGLHEVAPFVVDTGMGQYVMPTIVMTKSTYDELPQQLRDAIDEVSREALQQSIDNLADAEDRVCQAILDEGGTVTVLPEADIERWRNAVADDLRNQWAADKPDPEAAETFLEEYISIVRDFEEETDYEPGVRRCAEQSQ